MKHVALGRELELTKGYYSRPLGKKCIFFISCRYFIFIILITFVAIIYNERYVAGFLFNSLGPQMRIFWKPLAHSGWRKCACLKSWKKFARILYSWRYSFWLPMATGTPTCTSWGRLYTKHLWTWTSLVWILVMYVYYVYGTKLNNDKTWLK